MELGAVPGCSEGSGESRDPTIDLVGHIGKCHHSLRVLNRIPKRAANPVADALQRLIREALDRGSEIVFYPLVIGVWSARVSPAK